MSIKSTLDSLTSEQRRRLYHAFDNNFSQYIELDDSKFIGVNVSNAPDLIVEEQVGVWTYGHKNLP